jgi:hypothetical protein
MTPAQRAIFTTPNRTRGLRRFRERHRAGRNDRPGARLII